MVVREAAVHSRNVKCERIPSYFITGDLIIEKLALIINCEE